MSVNVKCLLEAKIADTAQTTQYSAPASTRTIIDKFTAYCYAVTATTFAVNVVASGGSVAAGNCVTTKTIAPGECYLLPELVGHVLNSGDFISTLPGAATSIIIRISGREIT